MQPFPALTSVILQSAGGEAVKIEDMTLDQAREALHVLGRELFMMRENHRRESQALHQIRSMRAAAEMMEVVTTFSDEVKKFSTPS